MKQQAEKLLQSTRRPGEIVLGFVCGVIGLCLLGLFVWLTYLVAWRNPRDYGVYDLWKPTTLGVLTLFLAIAILFLRLGIRLLIRPKSGWLFTPLSLRLWGGFFGLMSIPVFLTTVRGDDWVKNYHAWMALSTFVTMAVAAFILARRRERQRGQVSTNNTIAGPATMTCGDMAPISAALDGYSKDASGAWHCAVLLRNTSEAKIECIAASYPYPMGLPAGTRSFPAKELQVRQMPTSAIWHRLEPRMPVGMMRRYGFLQSEMVAPQQSVRILLPLYTTPSRPGGTRNVLVVGFRGDGAGGGSEAHTTFVAEVPVLVPEGPTAGA